jgi:hypothetical protein
MRSLEMLKKIDFRTVDLTATKPEADANLSFGELARAWIAAVQSYNDELRLRKCEHRTGRSVVVCGKLAGLFRRRCE